MPAAIGCTFPVGFGAMCSPNLSGHVRRRFGEPSVRIHVVVEASDLFLLLRDVVVVVAEGLPVLAIPEELAVASVRDDVIHDEAKAAGVGLGRAVLAHGAWVEQATRPALQAESVLGFGEEVGPGSLPPAVIAALA